MEVLNILYNNSKPVKRDDTLINEEIRVREVLLIGADGTQFGVKSTREAMYIASQEGLDLVMVAPGAKPPVCKLMDYSKFRYEQQRKAREARKNQKVVELKEIRLTAVIDTHDFETKIRNAIKFLEKGDKLKVSVRLPYRAGQMLVLQGKEVLEKFKIRCFEVGELEKDIMHEGRYITMTLGSKKK
ncbi:MAG: translation initiation factor IF-3 [Firmicutes bacterium]|nr:translation initiation factor IF-3 [Bacillota bacterium]